MTTTQVIMLIGIIVSAVIAILVAYQQRRQMRQIELYKLDPSVGLTPAPTAITRFIKSNWESLLAYGGPILNLTMEFTSSEPVTRWSVLIISFSVALLAANIVLTITFRAIDRVLVITGSTLSMVDRLTACVSSNAEFNARTTNVLEKLTGMDTRKSSATHQSGARVTPASKPR